MNANELAELLDDMEPYSLEDITVLEAAADKLMYLQAEVYSLREWKNTWLPYLRKHLGVTDL